VGAMPHPFIAPVGLFSGRRWHALSRFQRALLVINECDCRVLK